MSKFHNSSTNKNLGYQKGSEDSDVEYPGLRYSGENEFSNKINKEEYEEESEEVEEEEEREEDADEEDNDEEGNEEEDIDEEDIDEDTDTENEEFNDSEDGSSDNWDDNWDDNPHLEFIDLNNQHEIFWYSNSQEEQECNINSFEDFLFSLNGIESLNDLRGYSDINEQNNRFVMLGDSLASGGAYEYYNNDGSYYSQRADGSIIRRDKFGRERITPPEDNPRMGRRYRPY
ncbi:hypothetical protein RclHR1_01670004 [Rhizophagus clarus]|uniref:Uncharacterized protein n=1 Tax=Rhizophagus clarus TaxID=94130 RepID=A0A2Z6QI48_9GLOM|nr:hypothetical protein RclHR1_01670004 [Rhizophagus clarus]GES96080.1 hypothetical protein GLOIN_2v1490772 [Rhizophagus clarus]